LRGSIKTTFRATTSVARGAFRDRRRAWNAICVIRLPCTPGDTLTRSIAPILLANGTIMTKPLLSVSGLAAQPLRRDSDRLDFA
jgi:hypothetical protein